MTLYIADCGKSEAHVFNNDTQFYQVISHIDLLELNVPGIAAGDRLVIEEVHLRPRENNSLAQPYTYEQLLQLKQRLLSRHIIISLFPNELTPKARSITGLEKSDENDVRSIGNYLDEFPNEEQALKIYNPVSTEEHQQQHFHIWKDRELLSSDVNVARNNAYGFDSETYDEVTRWVYANALILCDLLGPELAADIGLTKHKRTGQLTKIKTPSRIYTILATLMRPNGELRLRSDTQALPEWKYVKKYFFCLSPYHRRGGVVASNYKYHMRPAISGFKGKVKNLTADEWRALAPARACADHKLKVIWTTIHNLLIEQGSL